MSSNSENSTPTKKSYQRVIEPRRTLSNGSQLGIRFDCGWYIYLRDSADKSALWRKIDGPFDNRRIASDRILKW